MRAYVAVFVSVFLAELGDKTQLATLFFAANGWSAYPANPAGSCSLPRRRSRSRCRCPLPSALFPCRRHALA